MLLLLVMILLLLLLIVRRPVYPTKHASWWIAKQPVERYAARNAAMVNAASICSWCT
jgi:hypothetical protein